MINLCLYNLSNLLLINISIKDLLDHS